MNCTGSIALTADMESSSSSVYADEGTAAAFLAEMALETNRDARWYRHKYIVVGDDGCFMHDGGMAGGHNNRTFEVDDEMVEHIQLYLDNVRGEMESVHGKLLVEQKVAIPGIDEDILGGTPDAVVAVPFGKLTVLDLKYGRGVVVEAVENFQLLVYLLGVEHTNVFSEFEVVIVQPRAPHPDGPVRRWTVTRERLREFEREVRAKAKEALGPNGAINAGTHCRWCEASGQCPAQLEKAREVAKIDFSPVDDNGFPEVELLSTERLGELYAFQGEMANWFKAMGAVIRERLNIGEDVPGWKLIKGYGNRAWTDEQGAAVVLKERGFRKKDLFNKPKPKLKSPAQVEKLNGRGFKTKKEQAEFVSKLTNRPEKEANLVPDSDKRLEHRPAHADFDDLTKGTDNG